MDFNLSLEVNEVFKGCIVKCKKNWNLLYSSHLEKRLYPFLNPILKGIPSTYQAQKKADIAYLYSILGHVGIEQMITTASKNDGIAEINKQEFNS